MEKQRIIIYGGSAIIVTLSMLVIKCLGYVLTTTVTAILR